MVLGYDEPRPKARNYQDFLSKLEKGLNNLGIKGLSLMIYGSYVREDYIPGISDIDAVLTFSDNVVIKKDLFREVAKVIAKAQKQNEVPFGITPCDLRTMSDGRFNSYSPHFKPYFQKEGKVLVGSDYRNKYKFELPTFSDQADLTFNLKKVRQRLLFSEQNRINRYQRFLTNFKDTLNSVGRCPNQILGMMDSKLRTSKFSVIEEISENFPKIDTEPLKRIKNLYNNLDRLDALYRNPTEVLEIWNDSVTFFESMIKAYLDFYPRNN